MISDLDREMEKRGVQSLIVFGDQSLGNPDLVYVVGASLARGGIYVKRRGNAPTLIVSNIDVGSAGKGRVRQIKSYSDYGYEKNPLQFWRAHERRKMQRRFIG